MNLFYGTASLRYTSPLTERQVLKALAFASSDSNKEKVFPTFWLQQIGIAKAENSSFQVINIAYHGDGKLVYNANFISGFYPGSNDIGGCAVSDTLAWNLWGSLDVNGQTLLFGEQSYTVRGVFHDDKDIILTGTAANAGFTAVELYGEHDSDARQAADMFAISSGLGLPNHIADGAAIVTLARMACFFPILITVIILLMMLWKTSRSFNKTTQHIIWFSLALIAALLLPYWLENIPQWMIPSMWSDFSFWGSLLQTIKFRIEEWFLIVPTVKEVHIKFLMLYQVSIIFIETSITSALVIKNFTFISEVKKV